MAIRSEDLMIGDWVRIIDDETNKSFVGTVTHIDGELENVNVLIAGDTVGYPYSIDCIEPITLSPEILEKNGFEYEKNVGYVYDNYEGIIITCSTFFSRLRIIKDLNILYDSQDYADIYVHTIQHALRICGIEKEIVL